MKTVNVSDLKPLALDWAMAARIEGLPIRRDPMGFGKESPGGYWVWDDTQFPPKHPYMQIGRLKKDGTGYSPCQDWARTGPLIRQYIGNLWKHNKINPTDPDVWTAAAYIKAQDGTMIYHEDGATEMIAVVRCVISMHCGPTIEIPDDLE